MDASSSDGLRKWLRRMSSVDLIATPSAVIVASFRMSDPPTWSNDSRNGVVIPRTGSPNAAFLCSWSSARRDRFASFLCFAWARAYGSLYFLLCAIVTKLAEDVIGSCAFEGAGRKHTEY